jgi:multiple sugar transport system substrate-binding protein
MQLQRFLATFGIGVFGAAAPHTAHAETLSGAVGPESAVVRIEVATVGASEAAEFFLGEIESFNQAHPGVAVSYYAIERPRRTEVPLNTMTHLGRNVIGLSSEAGTEPYYLVSRNLIVPIEQFLPDPEFSVDDYYENLWDAVTYKGKKWGVPFLCNAYSLFCNKARFEKAGIAGPPRTWQDFLDYATRLAVDTDGDGATNHFGANIGFPSRFEGSAGFLWKTMVIQKNGYFIKDGRFSLSHPALRESYDFIKAMLESGAVLNDPQNFGVSHKDPDKNYAMHVQPTYRIKELHESSNFRIAPLPTFDRDVSLDEKRLYLAVRKSTPEKEAASWEFIKWVCRKDSTPVRNVPSRFTFPARKDLLEREAVAEQFRGLADNATLLHTGKASPVQWHSLEADSPAAKDRFNAILDELFAGNLEFEAAMSKAEQECNQILRNGEGEVEPYALYK